MARIGKGGGAPMNNRNAAGSHSQNATKMARQGGLLLLQAVTRGAQHMRLAEHDLATRSPASRMLGFQKASPGQVKANQSALAMKYGTGYFKAK